MNRISLTEEQYTEIVMAGETIINSETIKLEESDILSISLGMVACIEGNKYVCLRDIGNNRIKKILKEGNYDNIINSI